MHQPSIPAGANGELISHLQYMYEHPGEGDNHNADAFAHCYKRLAEIIPQLINEGCNPRIMLDYSGNLLWGFEQMGRQDILAGLAEIVNEVAGIPAESVQIEKSFVDDLDVDSLSMVEVVMACEDKFGVTIPDTEVKNLNTVADAVNYIAANKA